MNSDLVVNKVLKCTNITTIIQFVSGEKHVTYWWSIFGRTFKAHS